MRIGLDTSFLGYPPSGIGAYVTALLEHLPGVDPGIEIVSISPPDDGIWTRLSSRASRFGWESLVAGLSGRRANIDLLHVPMMARPALAGVPVVVTVHDVIPFVMPEYHASRAMKVNLAVARQSLRFAAAVITPSHHAKADVVRVLGIPEERVHVTWEAADRHYRPASETERSDWSVPERFGIHGRYVFNVGGLDARKNLATLIRSFAIARTETAEDVWLVISGSVHADNPVVYPPLQPLIAELGVEDRVILTGRVSEDDKLALLQRAAVYATPTLYEGFGLPVLEAMACGVPVVASNRTSLPEIIGEAGMRIEPRVPEFTEALVTLLNSSSERERLSAAGLDRARQFSWDRTARETVSVYHTVLGKD